MRILSEQDVSVRIFSVPAACTERSASGSQPDPSPGGRPRTGTSLSCPLLASRLRFAGVALLTVWATFPVSAAPIPRPEHPRPDFRRDLWLNLNGTWQFEVDPEGDGEKRGLTAGHDLAGLITVPFCPESKLSGIGNTDFMLHVWYRRRFRLPSTMVGRRLLLHFGAVDWLAQVWLNGQFLGRHRGGYTPFQFDITGAVRAENELVVQVFDDARSGLQATGKQTHSQSHGCVYTRTTGIWQTVWIEAVGETYLRQFVLTPDVDGARVLFQGWMEGPCRGLRLRLRAFAGNKEVGRETVPAAWRNTFAVVKLTEVHPWTPDSPYLYRLLIDTLNGRRVVDRVHTYFGLRKITLEGNRFLLNGKPIFQRLVLDQGFYPDGIYTAPTDAALRRDIELSQAAGFNGARLHQKIFEPRYLYWADKLGYLVWDEYPSWGVDFSKPEALTVVLDEWRTEVVRDRNHPAVVGWCPLNETGGGETMADVQRLLAVTQDLDPTRPFLDTSGYTHLWPHTDIFDTHDYAGDPKALAARYAVFRLTGGQPWNNRPGDPRSRYRGQPFFLSEFGGIHVKTPRDTKPGWGYGKALAMGEFLKRYEQLTGVLLNNPNMFGFCYTQLTDIEQEQNGVYFYDRKPKYDPALIRVLNRRLAACETQPPRVMRFHWTTLLPTAETTPQVWRYTTVQPAADWYEPGFDTSTWKQGKAGFGTPDTPGALVGTRWDTSDLWIRREFDVSRTDIPLAGLRIHHDEDATVYVNGRNIMTLCGYTTGYVSLPSDRLARVLVPGRNVIAVHCHQTVGGQFLDVGILAGREHDTRFQGTPP